MGPSLRQTRYLCTLKKAKAEAAASMIPSVGRNALSELQHSSAQAIWPCGVVTAADLFEMFRVAAAGSPA